MECYVEYQSPALDDSPFTTSSAGENIRFNTSSWVSHTHASTHTRTHTHTHTRTQTHTQTRTYRSASELQPLFSFILLSPVAPAYRFHFTVCLIHSQSAPATASTTNTSLSVYRPYGSTTAKLSACNFTGTVLLPLS